MSSYRELIKNFEHTRAYMRDFYVYGFKNRNGYDRKSARTYDDERRRMESWLSDHMHFIRTPDGKTVFLSVDSRRDAHNPLYRAWKAKSFTDGDITLHFILLDILHDPSVCLSLGEIIQRMDKDYLSAFPDAPLPDASTVRGKLNEYTRMGLLTVQRDGRRTLWARAADRLPDGMGDLLDFFSEAAPCGVIGSFLLDREEPHPSVFCFKHHYITETMDSDILAGLFCAMREKRSVTVKNQGRGKPQPLPIELVPLRIYISTQSGRQHLMAWNPRQKQVVSLRLDYLSDVTAGEVCPDYDRYRAELDTLAPTLWGVHTGGHRHRPERVSFTVRVREGEAYIVKRLEREGRGGLVEKVDDTTYRYTKKVLNTQEMVPWIRTFICRIVQLDFSNRTAENEFRADLEAMYRLYGLTAPCAGSAPDLDISTPGLCEAVADTTDRKGGDGS